MNRMEKAEALRNDPAIHYNCCQSVLIPFAAEMGLSEEQALRLGINFGSGMRHGSTCGALSGAMMVLGAAGCPDQAAAELLRRFRQDHGCTDCAHLLSAARERGEERKPHCDGLVYEMVSALDAILRGAAE